MSDDGQFVHLKNFDILPSDRWCKKFKTKRLTQQGDKLWSPLGIQTCENQYVHHASMETKAQLQGLMRCLSSQRWNLNRDTGLYLYHTYFGRPVTQLFPGEIASEYLQVIATPMDFHTLLNNITNDMYNTNVELFFGHLSLIWRNAIQYTLHLIDRKINEEEDLFFPLNAGLALRYFAVGIALKHFNVDLNEKYPMEKNPVLDAL